MSSAEYGESRLIQCPRCGRPTDRLVSGICLSCFLETASILRVPKMQVAVCPICLRYRDANKWRSGEFDLGSTIATAARDRLIRKLKMTEEALEAGDAGTRPVISDVRIRDVRLSRDRAVVESVAVIDGLAGPGKTMEVAFSVAARLRTSACRACQLRQADYYACILQVRAEGRIPEEAELKLIDQIVDRASAFEQPGRYVSKIVDRKEGRDLYLPSAAFGRDLAKQATSQLGGTLKETRKLVGVDRSSSKKLYRITILLRLPSLRVGDIAELNGKLFAVLRNSNQGTALLDLEGNAFIHERRSGDLKLASRREEVGEALVLEVRPDGIQILDPRSNQAIDIMGQKVDARVGQTVTVIWRDGVAYLAPRVDREVTRGA